MQPEAHQQHAGAGHLLECDQSVDSCEYAINPLRSCLKQRVLALQKDCQVLPPSSFSVRDDTRRTLACSCAALVISGAADELQHENDWQKLPSAMVPYWYAFAGSAMQSV